MKITKLRHQLYIFQILLTFILFLFLGFIYCFYEIQYKKAHEIGNSKVTFQKLYQLYLKKLNNPKKAQELKGQFEKN